MRPIEQARAVYEREPCKRSFDEDLRLHMEFGFVFATPEFFIMGRPVWHEAPLNQIVFPGAVFDRAICDCWHVYLMAGDIAKAWSILPWPLPWISFERKNELRFYKFEDIRRFSYAFTAA